MGAAALSVHPRLRGELVRTLAERKRAGGSSPLTRGTLNCSRQGGSNLSVHPRLRGELNIRTADAMAPTGSSPLTRGTPFSHRNICVLQRFIPAYAGNSVAKAKSKNRLAVHPRLRGELLNASKKGF